MPSLFWLALLFGFLTGVAVAVALLPRALIAPLYGPLALAAVVVVAALGVLLRLRRVRGRAARAAAAPAHELPGAAVDPADPDGAADQERWPLIVRLEPPGVIGPAELREILYQGRVDARLRPITSLMQPEAAWYYALPRLRAADDSHLEPQRYRATAARSGLLGLIDRLLLLRCAAMLSATRADGRKASVLCGIAAASLSDPAFLGEVDQQLKDDPKLVEGLVLALDHAVRDRPSAAALARLRRGGLRFCLRRVGPPPSDAAEVGAGGFDFVLLESGRFALGDEAVPGEEALLKLQQLFGSAGPTLLVERRGADRAAIELPGAWSPAADGGGLDLARPSAA